MHAVLAHAWPLAACNLLPAALDPAGCSLATAAVRAERAHAWALATCNLQPVALDLAVSSLAAAAVHAVRSCA